MSNKNMVFAGFGGQGVLFAGKVVAYAGMLNGQEVTWLPSYGPEMRGGTANCSVCISERPIGSPLVSAPDILVAMNGPSFDKFIDAVAPGGKVFVDSSMTDRDTDRTDIEVYKVPATSMSGNEHLDGIANMVLLGKALSVAELADLDTIEAALKKCVPASKSHLLEHNLRAIQLGMAL